MFLLQFCLPKLKWNGITQRFTFAVLKLVLCVSVAEDFHLVIAKLTRKRRRKSRYRLSLWITGSLGEPEDRAHDTLAVLIVRDSKSKGIWSHPVLSAQICSTQLYLHRGL